ncbi:MAG: hypothetical protein ACM3JJ_11765 [Hyphomicrobiales bacterium]
MVRPWMLAIGLTLVAFTTGCNDHHDRIVTPDNPPYRVEGVYSVTGDGQVTIYWTENQESDIAYYKIYRNFSSTGTFTLIGTATAPPYVDHDVTNGTTYYYALSAVDDRGQESAELSYENVFDTPRPEGSGVVLTDANTTDATSGWDFSAYTRRASANALTDMYYAASGGHYLIYAVGGTEIQDAGYVALVDVDYAPPAGSGWSADGVVEAIPGHSYIVLTADDHFAKFEVVSRDDTSMVMNWAYQIDPNNRELVRKLP